jgi:tetratricopeptide (TPR) repeat protein
MVLVVAGLTLVMAGCARDHWRAMRTDIKFNLAREQFEHGDLDHAETTLKEALAVDPDNAEIHCLAGRIALERGQLERAYHLFEMAIEHDPKLASAFYYRAIVAQRWQRYQDALAGYEHAYDLRRDNAAYLLAVGEMLVALGRNDQALELLSDKVRYFDQNAGLRVAVAQLHAMRGEWDQAVDLFQQAALLQPDNLQTAEDLALALAAAGRHDDAIDALQRLIDRRGGEPRADLLRALAESYRLTDRHRDARQVYVELVRRDPEDGESWLRLGELAWQAGDLSGALTASQRAMAVSPRQSRPYVLAGLVWKKRGQPVQAAELFARAASFDPEQAEPWLLRGLALEEAGQIDEARRAYEQARDRAPGDARVSRLLAGLDARGNP